MAFFSADYCFLRWSDLGWDDVGFRSHQIRTPNIDRMASEGRVLNHYYVQDVCSPSRATFQLAVLNIWSHEYKVSTAFLC